MTFGMLDTSIMVAYGVFIFGVAQSLHLNCSACRNLAFQS